MAKRKSKRKSRKKTYRMKSRRKSRRAATHKRKSTRRKKSVKRKSRRKSRRKSVKRKSRRKSSMLEDFGTRDINEWVKRDIKKLRKKIDYMMHNYLNAKTYNGLDPPEKHELDTMALKGYAAVKELLRLQKELCTVPPTQTGDLAKKAYYDCFKRQDLTWEALEKNRREGVGGGGGGWGTGPEAGGPGPGWFENKGAGGRGGREAGHRTGRM